MVASRCATAIVVRLRPFAILSNASCTSFSLSESRELVASSSSSTRGFLIRARAIEILCLCPLLWFLFFVLLLVLFLLGCVLLLLCLLVLLLFFWFFFFVLFLSGLL